MVGEQEGQVTFIKPLNVCATRDVTCKRRTTYVGNYFDCRCDFAGTGCVAHVAAQQTVGLLSEWRTWLDSFDTVHPVTVGQVIGG